MKCQECNKKILDYLVVMFTCRCTNIYCSKCKTSHTCTRADVNKNINTVAKGGNLVDRL